MILYILIRRPLIHINPAPFDFQGNASGACDNANCHRMDPTL